MTSGRSPKDHSNPLPAAPDGQSLPSTEYRPKLWYTDLGVVGYRDAARLQHKLREARQLDKIPDSVLILEHPPVYTLGRRTDPRELPMEDRWYENRGIAIEQTDRGGRATYHGPDQLVAYPILSLGPLDGDVVLYIRLLERTIIAALSDVGVRADPGEELTGVWAGDRKIAAIGIHVSRGVTTHGMAINLMNDLAPFEWIVPCGIEGCRVTSVAEVVGWDRTASMAEFKAIVGHRLAEALGRTLVEVDAESLIEIVQPSAGSGDLPREASTPSNRDEPATGNETAPANGGRTAPRTGHKETPADSRKATPTAGKGTMAT